MAIPIVSRLRSRPDVLDKDTVVQKAVAAARRPELLRELAPQERAQVEPVLKAIQYGGGRAPETKSRPLSAAAVARRAAQALGPASSITPPDIAAAMVAQGLDMVEPFPPGQPLVPYYGYNRRPRGWNYPIAYNVTTEVRPFRIPFQTLYQLWQSYDVSQACTRYSIQDLRSMRLRFEAMDGYEDNPTAEIKAAKAFIRRPDGKQFFRNFLAQNQRNLWIFDSAPIYRLRDKAGRLKRLINITPMTIAPNIDYFGDFPDGDAPAFQQFVTGVPWDWLRWKDLIYAPFWPQTDSPYGTPPLETVLINANTDVKLQLYFLQFFEAGQVPEMFAMAPEDMTSPDDLADFQEQWTGEFTGTQKKRHGLKWLPHGTELQPYKPEQFDPTLAEYVMRRTIAAFGLVPQNLGILETVNRSSSDTQMDQQFRVSTLPIVGYYEDLLDSVLQDTLTLPVQVRFDTGREKEDRLMEAQAHLIYWQMGAESADEVREKVLGHPVNPEERLPRGVMDQRIGWTPAAYQYAVAGEVDPLTGVPKPGTVKPIPFTPPTAGLQGSLQRAGGGADPKAPQTAQGNDAAKGLSDERAEDSALEETGDSPDEYVGYGMWDIPQGSSGQGTGTPPPPVSVDEAKDLRKWRQQSRRRVVEGKAPRHFSDSAIEPGRYGRIWKALEGARSPEDVERAFAKAKAPIAGGIVVQAEDTGRVLLVQRTPTKHDPHEAYARWEFPGGKLTGNSPWGGALREWSEETGATLRHFTHLGNWTSPDGTYVGYVVSVPSEQSLPLAPQREEVSDARWWTKADLDDPTVRDKVTETLTRVRPLLKAWTAQRRTRTGRFTTGTPKATQFHRTTTAAVARFTPQVQAALTASIPPAVLSTALAPVGVGAGAAAASAAAVAVVMSAIGQALAVGALVAVVVAIYRSAWAQGEKEATGWGGAPVPQTVRSQLTARQVGLWVRNTMLNRIQAIVEEDLRAGKTATEIAADIRAYLATEAHARLIADTEYVRAWYEAAMAAYRQAGISEVTWVHQPGACWRCMENVAASPQPAADPQWPQGPIPVHPGTRCAVVPARS